MFAMSRVLLSLVVVSAEVAYASTPFQALPKVGDEADALFCGIPSTPIEKVGADGRIHWVGSRSSRLPLHKTDSLDWVWIHPEETALYVAYEATSRHFDGSNGGVCKFTANGERQLWCKSVAAFNITVAISASGALYVTGIGMVSRIRKSDGRYLWRVSGLYDKDKGFNAFRVPIEEGTAVSFYNNEGQYGFSTRRIVVNRDSGAIVGIDVLPEGTTASSEFVRIVPGCTK